jgi:hypothetical protein
MVGVVLVFGGREHLVPVQQVPVPVDLVVPILVAVR